MRTRRRPSLRFRITGGALVVVIAALCGAGFLVTGAVERQMTNHIDASLRADGDFTARMIRSGSGLPMREGPTDLYVQFIARDGRVVGTGTAARGRPALGRPRVSGTDHLESTTDPVLGDLRVLTTSVPNDTGLTLVLARSSAKVAAMRASLVRLLMTLLLAGSALLGSLIWIVVGRALRPVDAMRRSVDAIGDDDLSRRVIKPGTGDELDRLAETLNALLRRLDVTVSRERRFVADASHELRTPIAGVRALLETEALEPGLVATTRAEALSRVGELGNLVEQLLILARTDSHHLRPTKVVDLDELVLSQARQLARTTGLGIDTSAVSGGQVHGCEMDLARLVENLATNALRYARTTMSFSVQPTRNTVELAVADDGPGIPVADRDRIFERFSTLDDSHMGMRPGAGLGLSIVEAIVAAHRGTLRVEDTAGGGARFVVTLPAIVQERESRGRNGRSEAEPAARSMGPEGRRRG
jgi:signal transduction histidine kinase